MWFTQTVTADGDDWILFSKKKLYYISIMTENFLFKI